MIWVYGYEGLDNYLYLERTKRMLDQAHQLGTEDERESC